MHKSTDKFGWYKRFLYNMQLIAAHWKCYFVIIRNLIFQTLNWIFLKVFSWEYSLLMTNFNKILTNFLTNWFLLFKKISWWGNSWQYFAGPLNNFHVLHEIPFPLVIICALCGIFENVFLRSGSFCLLYYFAWNISAQVFICS